MKKLSFFILSLLLCFPVWADLLTGHESVRVFEHTYHIPPILFAMFLTAIVETFLLWCFKYRRWKVLTYFFILNLISNYIVNFVYYAYCDESDLSCQIILILEASVVLFEAGLLGLMTGYNKKFWISVFLTNLASFLLGVLLFGL